MDISGGYDTGRFVVEFYDLIPHHLERPDIQFYTGIALENGGPMPELDCGTGRILLPTARQG